MHLKKTHCIFYLIILFSSAALSQSETDTLKNFAIIDSSSTISNKTIISTPTVLKDTIVISFVKYKILQSADSSLFNILKIINYKKNAIEGELKTSYPEGWGIIGAPSGKIKIEAGDSMFIPFRITIPKNCKGGQASIISTNFLCDNVKYPASSFVEIFAINKWTMNVDMNTIYFNDLFESVSFKVYLSNKGNTNELIKLSFDIGKLLQIEGFEKSKKSVYIDLPQYTDSTIIYTVRHNDLSEDDLYTLDKNWNESTIKIKASNAVENKKITTIWFKKINSSYFNLLSQFSTPLNIEAQLINLLSPSAPKLYARAWGLLLFPKNRELVYSVASSNLSFSGATYNDNYFKQPQNLSFFVKYTEPKYEVSAGDINITCGMSGISGRGITAKYNLSERNNLQIGAVKKIGAISGSAYALNYNTKITKKIAISTGLIFQNDNSRYYDRTGLLGQISSGYTFFRHHHINAGLMISSTTIGATSIVNPFVPIRDTSLVGKGYRLNYNYSIPKVTVNLQTNNNRKNYVGGTGSSFTQGNASYILPVKGRINLFFTRTKSEISGFPQSLFVSQKSYSEFNMVRLTYAGQIRSLYYEGGPMIQITKNNQYNFFTGFNSLQSSQFKALFATLKYKLSNVESVSTGITWGYMKNHEVNIFNVNTPFPTDNIITSRFNLNYTKRFWSIFFSYNSTPFYAFDRSAEKYSLIKSQTINIRPTFEKYFYHRTIRLVGFANYSIGMPSNSTNLSVNPRVDFFLKKGWTLSGGANVFTSSRINTEGQKISNRIISASIGARKSFDIPQPRIKYYNFKAICFDDVNGNKTREENEPLLSNIIIGIEKDLSDSNTIGDNFAQMELITDAEGEINYYKMPQGFYKLHFLSLFNLKNLINVNGSEQNLFLKSNTTLYVPYAKAYRVKGKINVIRDEFSSAGAISLKGVRVTATAKNGTSFSVLTDEFGIYSIDIPSAGKYNVKINNVFGENFIIENDEQMLDFNGIKVFELNFTFKEEKRKVKMNGGYQFNLNNDRPEESNTIEKSETINDLKKQTTANETTPNKKPAENTTTDSKKSNSPSTEKEDNSLDNGKDKWAEKIILDAPMPAGVFYKVQIGVYKNKIDASLFKNLTPITGQTTPNGISYAVGLFNKFKNAEDALNYVKELGYVDAFISAYKDGKKITIAEAKTIEQ